MQRTAHVQYKQMYSHPIAVLICLADCQLFCHYLLCRGKGFLGIPTTGNQSASSSCGCSASGSTAVTVKCIASRCGCCWSWLHLDMACVLCKKLKVTFAERNPNFRKDALAALPKNKTIAVMCSLGGTMLVGTKPRAMSGNVLTSAPDRVFGRESRSLKACYELYEVGIVCECRQGCRAVFRLAPGLLQLVSIKQPIFLYRCAGWLQKYFTCGRWLSSMAV